MEDLVAALRDNVRWKQHLIDELIAENEELRKTLKGVGRIIHNEYSGPRRDSWCARIEKVLGETL